MDQDIPKCKCTLMLRASQSHNKKKEAEADISTFPANSTLTVVFWRPCTSGLLIAGLWQLAVDGRGLESHSKSVFLRGYINFI